MRGVLESGSLILIRSRHTAEDFMRIKGFPQQENAGGSKRMLPRKYPLLPLYARRVGTSGHSTDGLTKHRVVSHGCRPGAVKPSQRGQCEEKSMHLLSCPALKSFCCRFALGEVKVEKPCFTKKLSQYLLVVERLCSRQPSPTDATPIMRDRE
ncbi:hypothetical protein DQ04_05721010 [Trypanosoma grayi]|uniref:hypothetical protein n=1 Tax=Trypanosoma grayi TaxID=71804 RepID=UPI0004F45F57|nr:hypothetical protein DQ04_05721010 [Trypanosoma grayi]KEG09145.1 hypothetical protein DQ04_05721010 [Trypanosoma grayi]